MDEQINEFLDELVYGVSNLAGSLGINRVAGQLYVLLFLSERPLSLDEMTQKLKISKGHVSTNIRALERWQAVRKIWVKGSRKDYYQANPNTIHIIVSQLKQGLSQRFEELEKVIEKGKEKIKYESDKQIKGSESQIKNLEEKLKQIEKMYKKVKGVVGKLNLLTLLK